ncbi:MAG: HAMP domain-containing protein [Alphaproteobacteria bacterium]|nr:HAMP domain-containing protein [Alphaproteobacteria bacterium]
MGAETDVTSQGPGPAGTKPPSADQDRGNKSIVRQMWRSLAMLLVVLVVSAIVSGYLLLGIVNIVRQIIEVEDPLERAALEMEINAGEATYSILNYVTHPDPRQIDRFEDSNMDFARYAEQFSTLTKGGPDEALGDSVLALQRAYQQSGEEIIATVAKRTADLTTVRQKIREIDALIDDTLQPGFERSDPDHVTKLAAALEMEINTDEAFAAVESYMHEPDEEQRREFEDAMSDFQRFESQYRTTPMSSAETNVLDHISAEFAAAAALGTVMIQQTDHLNDTLARFRGEIEEFDDVMDDHVQMVVLDRKMTAHAQTQGASWTALLVILVMALFILAVVGLSTWVTTRKIVRSFWLLVFGIDQYAEGNLDHRIEIKADDELGKLGLAFNKMVEQRKAAIDALDEKNRVLAELSSKLSKYLSPQVYESIFRGEQEVAISTTRKKLTVFFSDIKDFTATTDDLEPEELAYLLNDYLTEMSEIALAHGATIDKYVGDAMLLFFGDPTTKGVQEDALACVRMAIAMQRCMVGVRAKWRDRGLERRFHVRIGINTGFCNVGNFGSEERMDYTIIGGEVNLAARLEGAAPVDGIMMAHETHALVKNEIAAEEQEPITVKGFPHPVRTYAVTGIYDDIDSGPSFIHAESEALRLHVDLNKLDAEGRRAAADELERQAARLREETDE